MYSKIADMYYTLEHPKFYIPWPFSAFFGYIFLFTNKLQLGIQYLPTETIDVRLLRTLHREAQYYRKIYSILHKIYL